MKFYLKQLSLVKSILICFLVFINFSQDGSANKTAIVAPRRDERNKNYRSVEKKSFLQTSLFSF